jgi:hypothetical protein
MLQFRTNADGSVTEIPAGAMPERPSADVSERDRGALAQTRQRSTRPRLALPDLQGDHLRRLTQKGVQASRRFGGMRAPMNQNSGMKIPMMNMTQWPLRTDRMPSVSRSTT